MTDSRPVMKQYNDLLGILGRFTQHKINMDEAIQVSCIIDKLPPSWKDFKHTLKYLKEELTLVELGSHLRIEESLRTTEPRVKEALNASLLDMLSIPWLLVPRPSLKILNRTEDIEGLVIHEEVTEEVVQQPKPELRKTKRNRTQKDFGPEFQLYLIEGIKDEVSYQHSYCFNVEDDPKTFDEAMKSQDVSFWKEAINDEMNSVMGNNTWVLADLPLIARISTIRLLIAMTSIQNLIIYQMDVKTAFLNGDLDEERAPKQWHQKFDEVVLSNVYLLNQADKCVYIKFDETGKGVIIFLYVDDMLIFGTDHIQVDLTIIVINVLYKGHGGG
ncbi:zinc finger, CCHC-type containing protein [Tanacetum coccineum]|uniref:Zinc finger, CCHC-type containing protein n=1 Tax=Tanacetum coccineum TaxID=301880 RepID=A0ABQ5J524_9ASTR